MSEVSTSEAPKLRKPRNSNRVRSINFKAVDAVLAKSLLSPKEVSTLFGVTRMTFYNWRVGNTYPSYKKEEDIKRKVRQVVFLVQTGQWPTEEAKQAPKESVLPILLALLDQQS